MDNYMQVQKYNLEGYVVIHKLINENLIDQVLNSLDLFKQKEHKYFSQSRHRIEKSTDVNKFKYLNQSIQHPSKLVRFKPLKTSVSNLISSKEISNVLEQLTGHNKFIKWQDMLFDRSTGTLDHADNWYLDTFPSGNLIGIWIALEDIDENAGRFYVIPNSHELNLPSYQSVNSHEKYIEIVNSLINEKNLQRYAPALKKGDVLFWNSRTIHGSYSQKEEGFSRKSITAHYHPLGFARDKARELSDIKKVLNNLIRTNNPNIFFDDCDPSIFRFMFINYYKEIFKTLFIKDPENGVIMSRNDGL